MQSAAQVAGRSLGALSALLFFAMTTPLTDSIGLLRRLRAPETLLDIMTLCYRTLFVFSDAVRETTTAQAARLGYATSRQSLRSLGILTATLTVQVWQRSQALHAAALARNGDGPLRFQTRLSPFRPVLFYFSRRRRFDIVCRVCMSGNTRAAILELQNVCFRYPDGSTGLDHCSLSIHSGSRTAVLGANGSGKTTLFLHLNGILRPQSGTIACSGKPLTYTRQGLHDLRSRVGLVFQNPDSQLFSASVRRMCLSGR